jgi:hypothetical protein
VQGAVGIQRLDGVAIARPPMIQHAEAPGDPAGGLCVKPLRAPYVYHPDWLVSAPQQSFGHRGIFGSVSLSARLS